MTNVRKALEGVLLGISLVAFTLACEETEGPVSPVTVDNARFGHGTGDLTAGQQAQLAQLRRATAPFQNFNKGVAAGWDTPVTVCWFHGQLGAMGYHYANIPSIDGAVSLLEPELLVYEPKRNGGFRLVAVEYIVPIAAWQGATPPSLLGQQFHDNGAGLYILHVWMSLHNPSGMFMDWNPNASCQYAAESEDRAP